MRTSLKVAVAFIGFVTAVASVQGAGDVPSVDFSVVKKALNPNIHGGGVAPRLKTMGNTREVEILRDLNMSMCRTHDLTLHDGADPIVDFHHIFPVFSADPDDPASYRFGATDALFAGITNAGMKVFYRLGHSAEGRGADTAGGWFNSKLGNDTVADYEKAAKVLSKIVAHYNEGWANGHNMNIEYWEIWNEPNNSEGDWPGKNMTTYAQFFAKCVKRIKADHPSVKVGGPALTSWNANLMETCLNACVSEETLPDFISWHVYGLTGVAPTVLADQANTARAWLDYRNYRSMEIGITEWNLQKSWSYGWKDTGRLTMEGASWCAGVLASLPYSPLDFAQWYGSGWDASYGVYNGETGQLNKTYHALKAFGRVLKDCSWIVARTDKGYVNLLAAIDGATLADSTKGCLYVSDRTANSSASVTVALSGLSGRTLSNIRCYVTDTSRDMAETTDFTLAASAPTSLVLQKGDTKEAVWLVTFDLD